MNTKKIVSYIVISFFLSLTTSTYAFDTLQNLKNYTEKHEEFPPIENKNYLNPDYSEFNRKQTKSFLEKQWNNLLCFLGLKKKDWNIEQFSKLLSKVIKGRSTGEYISKLTPKLDSKFIIWGDIQGALHSLYRDLNKLKSLGIIDDTFKIIKSNHYFLFNGDVINRSPYTIETLTLVLRLMERNPEHVFYIRGNHEDKEFWHNFNLKKELQIKAANLSKKSIPLKKEVTDFFKTLPIALFLRPHNKNEFVCFTHRDLNTDKFKIPYFASFLLHGSYNKVQNFNLEKAVKTKDFVNIEAMFKGISRTRWFVKTNGLSLLPPDQGATTWTTISCPTLVYQKIYEYYNDSFVIMDLSGPSLETWTLTLYSQNVLKKDGFKTNGYYLTTGHPKENPPVKGKINIGCTLDLSKSTQTYGARLVQGITLLINQINQTGGINGKRIKLIILDHQYRRGLAIKRAEELLQNYNTNIILNNLGTPTTNALLDKIKNNEILMAFPFSGSSAWRKPEYSHFIHYRASYTEESKKLIHYAAKSLYVNKFALFFQNDAYGKDCLKGAKEELQALGFKESQWTAVPYIRNVTDAAKPAKKIKAFNPDAIFFLSVAAPAIELIRKLGLGYVSEKKLFGNSITDEVKDFLKRKGVNYIISHILSDPNSNQLEIVREYQAELKKQGHPKALSSDSLEGYINASIFVEAIKRIRGKVTKEKIIQSIEQMQNVHFKDLILNFDLNTRSFSKDIWIDPGEGPWIHYEVDSKPTPTKKTTQSLSVPKNPPF
jgi:branched-chain amino acid transport system substrate-binding protein